MYIIYIHFIFFAIHCKRTLQRIIYQNYVATSLNLTFRIFLKTPTFAVLSWGLQKASGVRGWQVVVEIAMDEAISVPTNTVAIDSFQRKPREKMKAWETDYPYFWDVTFATCSEVKIKVT